MLLDMSPRRTASLTVLVILLFLLTQSGWILLGLSGWFTHRVYTANTPKNVFAQRIGQIMVSYSSLFWLVGWHVTAIYVMTVVAAVATLQAGLGICVGCMVFSRITHCDECEDGSCDVAA